MRSTRPLENPYESPRGHDAPPVATSRSRCDRASAGATYGLLIGSAAGAFAMSLVMAFTTIVGWGGAFPEGSDPFASAESLLAGLTGALLVGGFFGGMMGIGAGLLLGAAVDWRLLRSPRPAVLAAVLLLAIAPVSAWLYIVVICGESIPGLWLSAGILFTLVSPISGGILGLRVLGSSRSPPSRSTALPDTPTDG